MKITYNKDNIEKINIHSKYLLYVYFISVWKEWIIVNNTFQAMFLANGDVCPGEKPRQTKVPSPV